MGREITNAEQESNVLSHIRHDYRMLHTHPYIDFPDRQLSIRRQLRDAICRVRAYRGNPKRDAAAFKALAFRIARIRFSLCFPSASFAPSARTLPA